MKKFNYYILIFFLVANTAFADNLPRRFLDFVSQRQETSQIRKDKRDEKICDRKDLLKNKTNNLLSESKEREEKYLKILQALDNSINNAPEEKKQKLLELKNLVTKKWFEFKEVENSVNSVANSFEESVCENNTLQNKAFNLNLKGKIENLNRAVKKWNTFVNQELKAKIRNL
jgi:hypothetical protein